MTNTEAQQRAESALRALLKDLLAAVPRTEFNRISWQLQELMNDPYTLAWDRGTDRGTGGEPTGHR